MDFEDGLTTRKDLNTVFDLKGKTLQAVPKIVDYVLQPGQEYEGAWHVEGMSHEHIISTVLFIMDRSDDIQGGEICFRRAWTRDEGGYIYGNVPQCRHPCIEDFILS